MIPTLKLTKKTKRQTQQNKILTLRILRLIVIIVVVLLYHLLIQCKRFQKIKQERRIKKKILPLYNNKKITAFFKTVTSNKSIITQTNKCQKICNQIKSNKNMQLNKIQLYQQIEQRKSNSQFIPEMSLIWKITNDLILPLLKVKMRKQMQYTNYQLKILKQIKINFNLVIPWQILLVSLLQRQDVIQTLVLLQELGIYKYQKILKKLLQIIIQVQYYFRRG